MTKDSIQKQFSLSDREWLYRAGWGQNSGDSSWAGMKIDSTKWLAKQGVVTLPVKDIDSLGWKGVGWFRLKLRVDSTLHHSSLAVFFLNFGAAEVYLDGRCIHSIGTVGRTASEQVEGRMKSTSFMMWLDGRSDHILAVKYSNHQALVFNSRYAQLSVLPSTCGFSFDITTPANALKLQRRGRVNSILQPSLVSGFILALSVLYLFLYLTRINTANKRDKANLLFSLFAFGYAFSWILSGTVLTLMVDSEEFSIWRQIVLGCFVFDATLVLLPMFLYAVFEEHLSKRIWILIVLGIVDSFGQLFVVSWFTEWWRVFANIAWIWSLFIVVRALRQKKPDAWFIAVGVFLYVFFSVGSTILALLQVNIVLLELNTIHQLSIPVGMALYLARRSARTNLELSQKLVEVQELSEEKFQQGMERERLEAENLRKSKELDEARNLQLSMLPHAVPAPEGAQIAVFMKTATEVGGDYYDFHTAPDGTLTLVMGDATGHGMKAGTMVTIAKSHFQTLAEESPKTLLERMNAGIRAMRLRGVFMGLTVVKLVSETDNSRRITLAQAGMPPVLIFRAATQSIEELVLKAPPLGAFANFMFQERETTLHTGDVLLLVSDGLTERFNAADEQLGDERIHECFLQNSSTNSQGIIEALVRLGDEWGGVRAQDDDVTLLAVRMTH